jgi:hypothetical protein
MQKVQCRISQLQQAYRITPKKLNLLYKKSQNDSIARLLDWFHGKPICFLPCECCAAHYTLIHAVHCTARPSWAFPP